MKDSLKPGLRHQSSLLIGEDLIVPQVSPHLAPFSEMPPIFATAYMVAFIEATCMECLVGHLDEDEKTVGIHIDVSHSAATPVGMQATVDVELIEVNKRILTFKVKAVDEVDTIGEGTHTRAIIYPEKFMAALANKGS